MLPSMTKTLAALTLALAGDFEREMIDGMDAQTFGAASRRAALVHPSLLRWPDADKAAPGLSITLP